MPRAYPVHVRDATVGVVVDGRGEAPEECQVEREAPLRELALHEKVPDTLAKEAVDRGGEPADDGPHEARHDARHVVARPDGVVVVVASDLSEVDHGACQVDVFLLSRSGYGGRGFEPPDLFEHVDPREDGSPHPLPRDRDESGLVERGRARERKVLVAPLRRGGMCRRRNIRLCRAMCRR